MNRAERRRALRGKSKIFRLVRGDYDRRTSRAFRGIVSKDERDSLGKVVRARHAP